MNKTIKIVIEIVLFIACVGLVYAIYSSIMEPVNFNKRMTARENIAIQRLKDIRTLQVAYKSANGKFTSSVDSLKDFYENGASVKPAYWMGWLLQDLHVPYDYLLAERDFALETLQKYKAIILPDLAVMTVEQIAVLKQYIEQGGRVLATHNTAKYDADMNDKGRARLTEFAGKEVDATLRAEVVKGRFAYEAGYPEREYTTANPRDLAISDKLNAPGPPPAEFKAALDWITEGILPLEVSANATTAIVLQRQASHLLIHAINYNTYPDGKQITRDENLRITVKLPDGKIVKSAQAITPDTPNFTADFALQNQNGAAQITLPSLETYTLIALELSPAPSF